MTWRDILNVIEGMNEDDKDTQAYFYSCDNEELTEIQYFCDTGDILTIDPASRKDKFTLVDFDVEKFNEMIKERS